MKDRGSSGSRCPSLTAPPLPVSGCSFRLRSMVLLSAAAGVRAGSVTVVQVGGR